MRPIKRRNVDRICRSIAEVDEQSFDEPMPLFRLREQLQVPHAHVLTAEYEDQCIAYLLYTARRTHVRIERIAVVPERRRMRVASGLLGHLTMDVEPEAPKFVAYVREDHLDALLFFRFFGFVSSPPYLSTRDDSGLDFVKFVHWPD